MTGASSGLGRAAAQAFANAGAHLILTGRNPDQLQITAAACPGNPLIFPADITQRDQVDALVAASTSSSTMPAPA
jgi:NADP-dependent 3-hydroxy acid dehydrogenase YdfG